MKQLCERKNCPFQWQQKIKKCYLCLVTAILLLTAPGGLVAQVSAFSIENVVVKTEPVLVQERVDQRRDLFFAAPIQGQSNWKSWRNMWRENEMRK